MRFLNAYTHFGFTKTFGSTQSKDVLLSFLNALIMFSTPLNFKKILTE